MVQTTTTESKARISSKDEVPATCAEHVGKVLLLSSVPPSSKYTGAIMLHSMCRALPADKLSCFAVLSPGMDSEIHADWKDIPYTHRRKPSESQTRHWPSQLGGLESYIKEQSIAKLAIPKLTKEIVAFAENAGAQAIWCTLEGQTMIRLALAVQKHLPLPMVAQVWDPPGWWLRDNNVDKFSRKKILLDFASVLSNSKTTLAAASWAMAEQYSKDYGCTAIPVIPGLPQNWAYKPSTGLNDSKTLTIGFAGQLYSSEEWNCLMQALESIGWIIEGRRVEVRALGRTFGINARGERNIRFYGWRSQKETIEILSGCDVLYCPYWFSSKFETESRLSFPSKLTSYLAAGRPVLFHGPTYASPARFLQEHEAALQCNDLKPNAVIETLRVLASDSKLYESLTANGTACFHAHLTEERTQAQFLKAMGY